MKSKVFGLLVVSIVGFSSQVWAKQLITLLPALMNEHEQIRAAEARRDEAQFLYRSSQGDWLPQLDLSSEAGKEWIRSVNDAKTKYQRNYASLKLTQLVSDFGATRSSIDRSATLYEKSVVELESIRQDVLVRAISAYLEIVKAREKLAYARNSEENIKTQTGMEETLVERGAGLSSDILQTKAQLASARALRVSVEGELLIAKNRFKAVYGYFPAPEDIESYQLPKGPADKSPATLEQAVAHALGNNPRLLAEQFNVQVAGHDLQFQKAKYLPKLNLVAEAIRREDDEAVLGVRTDGLVGAELTYNLFNGGSDTATIKAAAANQVEFRNLLLENKKIVEEQVRNAWESLLISREKHQYLNNQTEILGEFLQLARKERKLGTRSLLDVLNGEVEYINAVSQAVAAEIDTIMAAYNLFYAMGDLTMDSL